MKNIAFLSDGKINILHDNGADMSVQLLNCKVAEKYRQREKEIRLKNEWKHSGTGAMFTGTYRGDGDAPDIRLPITGLSPGIDERLFYAINFENGGGIYFKPPNLDDLETPILADMKIKFFELDVNPAGRIAVSCAENYLERHIALLKIDETYLRDITEGDCSDCNPKWSLKNEDVLYYDSAGIAYGASGYFAGFGPRSIYRLDTKTGQLDEVLEGGSIEYLCPFEDKDGNLYFIRRPYRQNSGKMSVWDYISAPFKVLRALGGWLDLFTRRHTGESLKTSGANPAKFDEKSPQQIYIDGNLLEAEKTLKENAAAGDKYPGYAPRDWELVKKTPAGEETVLKKSVISYCVAGNDLIYSNGKYIIQNDRNVKVHLGTKLVGY